MKKQNDLIDKLKVYSDFLDNSINEYANAFIEDYNKFQKATGKIESIRSGKNFTESIDNLKRIKIADQINETATAAIIALEALKEGRNKLYELFPELKAYSESKRAKGENTIDFNYHFDKDGSVSYDKV
jgi:hypothetical protein